MYWLTVRICLLTFLMMTSRFERRSFIHPWLMRPTQSAHWISAQSLNVSIIGQFIYIKRCRDSNCTSLLNFCVETPIHKASRSRQLFFLPPVPSLRTSPTMLNSLSNGISKVLFNPSLRIYLLRVLTLSSLTSMLTLLNRLRVFRDIDAETKIGVGLFAGFHGFITLHHVLGYVRLLRE